jgi:hypothetical protein
MTTVLVFGEVLRLARFKGQTHLNGKTWLRYSISVWDDIEKSAEEKLLRHPGVHHASVCVIMCG